MIDETPAGRVVTFGLSRDGQPVTVKVQLADKHKEFPLMGPKPGEIQLNIPEIHVPDIDIPSINMVVVTSSARSGLMVENITPQLGEFFGVKIRLRYQGRTKSRFPADARGINCWNKSDHSSNIGTCR